MKGIKVFDLGYEEAKEYFAYDAEGLEFLESLPGDERENYHLKITIDFDKKITWYQEGNWYHESEHLLLMNDKINNAQEVEDNFGGVLDFLKRENLL